MSDRTSADGTAAGGEPPSSDGTTTGDGGGTADGSAIELSWDCARADGVTFVGVRVRNPASVPRRVRLANRLDGPVLPPRSGGAPEPGYDADGVTVGVPADGFEPVGFACPAGPPGGEEPPVRIAAVDRVADAEAVPEPSPAERARAGLGDATPPRDAVPASGPDPAGDRSTTAAGSERRDSIPTADASAGAEAGAPSPEVDEWLAAVAARVETGERLTDASVPAATDALAAAAELDGVSGAGIDAAVDLDRQLAADAERLREVAERAESLAERAAAVDPPIEALRRLA